MMYVFTIPGDITGLYRTWSRERQRQESGARDVAFNAARFCVEGSVPGKNAADQPTLNRPFPGGPRVERVPVHDRWGCSAATWRSWCGRPCSHPRLKPGSGRWTRTTSSPQSRPSDCRTREHPGGPPRVPLADWRQPGVARQS